MHRTPCQGVHLCGDGVAKDLSIAGSEQGNPSVVTAALYAKNKLAFSSSPRGAGCKVRQTPVTGAEPFWAAGEAQTLERA